MSNDNAGEKPARRKPKVSLRNVNRRRVSRPLRRGRNAQSMGSSLIFLHLAQVRWRAGEGSVYKALVVLGKGGRDVAFANPGPLLRSTETNHPTRSNDNNHTK